jgi:hypothetical protein
VYVILIALICRILTCYSGLSWYNTDTQYYFESAEAIYAGHPISTAYPNGYPIEIALLRFIFNPSLLPSALIWLNIILSTCTVWLTVKIAERLTRWAWLAGLIVAFWPNQLNYTRQILTEVPTAFLLTFGIFLLLRKRYFVAGFILYLAALFRPTLLPLVLCYVLLMLVFKHPPKQILNCFLGFLLGLFIYQTLIFGGIVGRTDNLNSNLTLAVSSYSSNLSFDEAGADHSHALQNYVSFAVHHPMTFTLQRLDSLWELWGPWPSERGVFTRLLIGLRFPLLILGIIGFYRKRDFEAWTLFLPVLLITIVHTIFFSTPRYTFVVEPLLIVLATAATRSLNERSSLSRYTKPRQY